MTQAARELADRGFTTITVEDAGTTFSEAMHRSALQCFNIAFGKIRNPGEVLELIAPPSPIAGHRRGRASWRSWSGTNSGLRKGP